MGFRLREEKWKKEEISDNADQGSKRRKKIENNNEVKFGKKKKCDNGSRGHITSGMKRSVPC